MIIMFSPIWRSPDPALNLSLDSLLPQGLLDLSPWPPSLTSGSLTQGQTSAHKAGTSHCKGTDREVKTKNQLGEGMAQYSEKATIWI